jgi:anti-sigma factor RsiW
MDCEEVIGRLLELLDGQLSEPAEQAIRAHLAECESCRSEYDRLQAAHGAVRVAVADLAPERTYATPERVQRLMGAVKKQKRSRRIVRLYRTAAATAAVIAIAVCAPLIVSDVQRMREAGRPTGREPDVAFVQPERLMLASGADSQGMTTVRPVRADDAERRGTKLVRPAVARLDTAGVEVPVDNAFYDPDEAAQWW